MRLFVLIAVLLLMSTVPSIRLATADSAATPDSLLKVRERAAAVWDPGFSCSGGCAYVIGGRDANGFPYGDIEKYHPSAGTVSAVGVSFPARKSLSAVWAGTGAYIFGGSSTTAFMTDDIFWFDPTAPSIALVDKLPFPLAYTSAVWDPEVTPACPAGCAYVFGGATHKPGGGYMEVDTVLQYSPGLHTTLVVATLPTPRSDTTAVWVQGPIGLMLPTYPVPAAIIMGGQHWIGGQTFLDDILVFYPPGGSPTKVASLPEGHAYASASYDGRCVYQFGGYPTFSGGSFTSDKVVEFNPATLSVQTKATPLPDYLANSAAAGAGPLSYVFGGSNPGAGATVADIVSYNGREPATLGMPLNVQAFTSVSQSFTWLAWTEPSGNSSYCAEVDGYRVHRGGSLVATEPDQPGPSQNYAEPAGPGCFEIEAFIGSSIGPKSSLTCPVLVA